MEAIMKIVRHQAALRVLLASVACFCVASAAHADSRAALKLGQIGVINQTLQPKPTRSSPGSNNSNNANSTYDANSMNSNNGANTANPANNANAAYGRGSANGVTGNNR
jgi:hypothetical protein